jgi:hypothetical protein
VDQSELLDASLERAAEVLGDITAPAMTRFYETYPEARAAFEHHAFGNRAKLEAEMVENALYWAMNWLDRPTEIIIQMGSSVPHHQETLKVVPPWYGGLLNSVIDVIAETIPADAPAELALWKRIRKELGETVEASKSTYAPRAVA